MSTPTFAIDTNLVGCTSEGMARLQRRHDAGCIVLVRSDSVETELMGAPPGVRDRLLKQARCYDEILGALVLDHSRLGPSLLGSDADAARLDCVFQLLFPQTDRGSARRQKIRDAQQVAAALRHGLDGLITRDKHLTGGAERLAAAFPGFSVVTPEELDAALDRKPPS